MSNKSMSVMKDIPDICSVLRSKYFGPGATSTDYKDSYVINNAIQVFPVDSCEDLLDESITEKDNEDTKISKSINFRQDCCKKLSDISKILLISEAETLRRILYYSIQKEDEDVSTNKLSLDQLKRKVCLLKSQLESVMESLNEMADEIAQLEAREGRK